MAREYNVKAQKCTYLLIVEQNLTPDEIESQSKRRETNWRKVVSRYNGELSRHTETEVVTQDPEEETKADRPYSVRAKRPPLMEKKKCKEGENRNTQVR
jgi:IMP dehydrogenase/GMP reductase